MPKRKSAKRATPDRPLLVIDGDSFAHRAYHGVPKTVRRSGGKGGGAIIGFANTMLKLYQTERPRAIVVGWDTLAAPNRRVLEFPAYRSGRDFQQRIAKSCVILLCPDRRGDVRQQAEHSAQQLLEP